MAAVESRITDHLDLWTAALKRKSTAGRGASSKVELYGIKKLRELILQLAVRGLLVPQDPNDEPASELLKKIAAEKALLGKEGKIKKDKPLPSITEDEKAFKLPEGWQWAKLGMLMEMFNGRAFSQTEWSSDGLPIIRIQNLNDKNAPFNYFSGDVSENNYVEAGTFLISWSGTPGTSFGAFVWSGAPGVLNQHINKCIIFGDEINKQYLRLAVNGCMDHLIESAQGGVGLKHVTKGTLNNCVFAIPPLAEQHRIVVKVDELMALCDQLEQQTDAGLGAHQTLVETLLSALTSAADHAQFASAWQRIAGHFDTLFTTQESINRLREVISYLAAKGILVKFPESSKRVALKEILSFGPRNGFSPKESPNETGQKVLKLGATSYGRLDLSQVKSFDDEIEPDSHLWLRAGDILIQRGNSHIFVGSNLLIEEDIENIIYPDLMMKLRVKEGILASYVSLCLSAPPARAHMWDSMTGTSGTMPKISKGVVESISIVVPSIDVQERIVLKTKQLLALCDQLKSRLSDAQITQLHLADALVERAIC
jgi:type I restriction enzyme, S subunit